MELAGLRKMCWTTRHYLRGTTGQLRGNAQRACALRSRGSAKGLGGRRETQSSGVTCPETRAEPEGNG